MPFAPTGPLHARPYTDRKGRVWHFDATSLNLEGQACFRSGELEVYGPNLTQEDQFQGWADAIERAG